MKKKIEELLEKYENTEEKEDEEESVKPEKINRLDKRTGVISKVDEKIKLDLKDKKIIYQLELNARQPISEIAKKVGLSKEVVNYRIKKLESEGIIREYYALIDLSKLGYINFRVYLKLIDSSSKKEKEILDFLANSKETLYVADIDGPYDISFGVATKDILDFETFYNKFKKSFKEFIGKDRISIFTAVYHFDRTYLLDETLPKTLAGIVGKSKQEGCDDVDSKILDLLTKNARIPLVDIAEKLLMPERTVAFRIKRLERNKIVLGYKPLFNLAKLGFEYYKLDIMLKNTSRLKELMNLASANPFITYIDQTIGGSDFEIDIEVKNKSHLFQIIEELKLNFPETREINYFTLKSYEKLIYLPEI